MIKIVTTITLFFMFWRKITTAHTNSYLKKPLIFTDGKEYYCEKHVDIYNQSCNVSFSSLNNTGLNVPEPVEPRENTNIFHDSDEDYPTENNLNQTDFSHTKPIVIDSDYTKYDKFHEVDSANHSFDDGVDVVDGIVKGGSNGVSDYEKSDKKKLHANSVDSGISNNINNVSENVTDVANGESEKDSIKIKSLPSRLSDLSLKESENSSNRDTSSDDDKFESDHDVSPRIRTNGIVSGNGKKNGISLNLKLQSEMRYAIYLKIVF